MSLIGKPEGPDPLFVPQRLKDFSKENKNNTVKI